MSDAREPQLRREFVIHGVSARAASDTAAPLDRLSEDFGPFTAAVPTAPALNVEIAVNGTSPAWAGSARRIEGQLGDAILWDGHGRLAIYGPDVGRPAAYLTEVRPYFAAAVLGRLAAERRAQQVHASGVVASRGAVLFVGDSGTGKTSLALAAMLAGAKHAASDIAVLERRDAEVLVLGLPQTITLHRGAAKWFADNAPALLGRHGSDATMVAQTGKLRLAIDTMPVDARSTPLAALVFPERASDLARPRARAVGRDESLVRLVSGTQAMARWDWPPTVDGQTYLERLGEVCCAAVERASSWHVQWCNNHRRNAALLADLVL